eukprot:g4566.t1
MLLLWIIAVASSFTATWACPDGQFPVAIECTSNDYAGIRWELLQHSVVVVSGEGGNTKTACLQGGTVTVKGWDAYGYFGWNGATLKVVGEDGTVYFPEWSGPGFAGEKKVQRQFTFGCTPGLFGFPNCTSCTGGKFGILWNVHTNESLACPYSSSTCPMGYYCMGTGGGGTPCPAGKYGNKTGQMELSACLECDKGTIALKEGMTQCSLCSKGSYCPNATSTVPCPAGKYGKQTGQTELSACLECDAGTIALGKGMAQCSLCSKGSYCSDATSTVPCPAGKYGNQTGQTELSACWDCPVGDYSFAGSIHSRNCTQCPLGSYCLGGVLSQCPAGKYGNRTGQTELSACIDCDTGTTALRPGMSRCSLCAAGSFCPNSLSRQLCPVGKYGNVHGAVNENTACSNNCSTGRYGFRGASRCAACPTGTFRDTGEKCISCPAICLESGKKIFGPQRIVSTS